MPRSNRVASESQNDQKAKEPKVTSGQPTARARRTSTKTARKGAAASESPPALVSAPPIKTSPRLLERYRKEVVPALVEEFGYKNRMEVPHLVKIVLNIGLGEVLQNARAPESAARDLAIISGQHPVTTRARKSIAAFKLRAGMPIGLMVTLRGGRMYYFMDRLINATLPRIRDFRGVSRDAFDGRGNFSLGIREQVIFPEIDYSQIDRIRGLQVSIVTTARTDRESLRLLELLGMPFAHVGVPQRQTA